MTQLAEKHETENRPPVPRPFFRRPVVVLPAFVLITLLIATAAYVAGLSRSPASQVSTHITAAPTVAATSQCATPVPASQWTPVGVQWKLTVTFLPGGSRQGQSEISLMSFERNGTLTATFPGATPSAPPTLPPAVDGSWCMIGANAFHYQFHDILQQQAGQIIAYVQTAITAYMTSATSYEAGGGGMAYLAKTGQPIPHSYNVTQTTATAISK